MKLTTPFIFLCLFIAQSAIGQNVPQGMKYQAVARNLKGQVMANQDIQLRISLYSDPVKREIAYQEIHKVITSELGLFSLSVGEGINFKGRFEDIPWSSEEIWMEVEVQTDDETDFITISDSKMLSVPYAFFAATAGELTGSSGERGLPGDPYGKVWSLLANNQTIPGRDKLGTGDMADLVIVTNDMERMRVLADGDIAVVNNMEIGNNLAVQKNVYLNTDDIINPHQANNEPLGETINFGDFTVESESSTLLTGTLDVNGATYLHNTLEVDGATLLNSSLEVGGNTNLNSSLKVLGSTLLGSNLDVIGPTNLNNTLDVDGIVSFLNTTESTAIDNGALVVEGGVGIGKNLNVGGMASFEGAVTFGDMVNFDDATQSTSTTTGAVVIAGGLGVGKNVNIGGTLGVSNNDPSFVATIENTNDGDGDGLVIKLGKTHPAWDGSNYANVPNPGAEFFDNNIATIRGWIEGTQDFEFTDVLGFIPAAYIAGTACNLVETLASELNDALGLPAGMPPITDETIFDAVNSFADDLILDSWAPDNPTTLIPGFTLEFPTDFCPDFLPSFSMPNIEFVDVDNSLKNENQFISFTDKDDRELGSIRAMSVTEWGNDYFDGVFLVDFISNTVSLDPLDIILSCITEFTALADDYNQIGVEYASGHGDYAEWLERENPAEIISRGDIVAVKGGKITKDLADAEQVMAVSEFPIVLGNLPDENKAHLGNNVAFMGQIPVKVMGSVKCGDYIVADATIPGYGVAKAEHTLTLEDMPYVVGRSWETKPGAGPKMVNTVVGVHNGDYFRIMKNYEQKLNASEARMESLEARVELLMKHMAIPDNE